MRYASLWYDVCRNLIVNLYNNQICMSNHSLIEIKRRVLEYVACNHIFLALNELESMIMAVKLPWTFRDRAEAIRQSYSYLHKYAISGTEDPQRRNLLSQIASDIRMLADEVVRYNRIADDTSQYFGKVRYENLQADSKIAIQIQKFQSMYSELSKDKLFGKPSGNISEENLEAIARRVFDLVWITFPYSAEDESALEEIVNSETIPGYFIELVISAIMLGAIEYFDERRLVLLAKYYLYCRGAAEVKALCALLIVMWMKRDCLNSRRFHQIFDTIAEQKNWEADFKMVFMNLVKSHDTERITRTMNEEIIPQLMKMRPGINKIMNRMEKAEDLMSLEENPEWNEFFGSTGLEDKLKELNDLQTQGGDVLMSTFANLKTFPFFHETANWFLPFYDENSVVSKVLGSIATDLGQIISSSDMMCDSDKYSVLFAMEQMPASNRRMMLDQFQAQFNQLGELRASLLNPEQQSRENIANHYIQDLYRFFKLYRRKGEFRNPFDSPINLPALSIIGDTLSETTPIRVAAEFYFKYKYYDEAAALFELISERESVPDAQIFQKLGFCRQRKGEFRGALDMYTRSEMLHPDSKWTLRHIAQCYRCVGDTDKAIEYYEKLSLIMPDDSGVALNLGHCYVDVKDYEKALKQYFKADFLKPETGKSLRSIAWTLLLKGDLERSKQYFDRFMNEDVNSCDKINYGHLQMAMSNYEEAIRWYSDTPVADFSNSINSDRRYLTDLGVDPLMIDIVTDTILSGTKTELKQ